MGTRILISLLGILLYSSQLYALTTKQEAQCLIDQNYLNSWGMTVGGLPELWAQRTMGPAQSEHFMLPAEISTTTRFGVIDGGNINFEDKRLKCLVDKDFCSDGTGSSGCHGACVTGLISSKGRLSVSPHQGNKVIYRDIDIYNKKYYGKEAEKSYARIISEYLESVINNEPNVRVINLSLVTPNQISPKLERFLKKLEEEDNVVIVFAAGNEAQSIRHIPMSKYGNIQYVSADSELAGVPSFYTNFDSINFTAPSSNKVKSTSYFNFGGTSAAAPQVSGSFVSLFKVKPELKASEAIAILETTSANPGNREDKKYYGKGRPNIALAAAVARTFNFKKFREENKKLSKDEYEKKLKLSLEKLVSSRKVLVPVQHPELCNPTKKVIQDVEDILSNFLVNKRGQCRTPRKRLINMDKLPKEYALKEAKSCAELVCLTNLNHTNTFYHASTHSAELCQFFKRHKIDWGILHYCSSKEVSPEIKEVVSLVQSMNKAKPKEFKPNLKSLSRLLKKRTQLKWKTPYLFKLLDQIKFPPNPEYISNYIELLELDKISDYMRLMLLRSIIQMDSLDSKYFRPLLLATKKFREEESGGLIAYLALKNLISTKKLKERLDDFEKLAPIKQIELLNLIVAKKNDDLYLTAMSKVLKTKSLMFLKVLFAGMGLQKLQEKNISTFFDLWEQTKKFLKDQGALRIFLFEYGFVISRYTASGGEKALNKYIENYKKKNDSFYYNFFNQIESFGPQASVPLLNTMKEMKKVEDKKFAIRTLGIIGKHTPEIEEKLIEFIDGERPILKVEALTALTKLEKLSPKGIKKLKALYGQRPYKQWAAVGLVAYDKPEQPLNYLLEKISRGLKSEDRTEKMITRLLANSTAESLVNSFRAHLLESIIESKKTSDSMKKAAQYVLSLTRMQ